MKKKDILEKILEAGTFLFFGALILNVSTQVFMRNFFPASAPVWTEEASRFLFIYSIVFAAPLAMKKREYVNVDLLLNIMPDRIRKTVEFLIDIVSTALFVIVFIKGTEFAKLGIGQTSAILRIPMQIGYSSIAITTFFIAIYGIYHIIRQVRGVIDRGDVS
ncbi:TRAP transporter small permease [Anaerosolibacter sp.]|uniref:TRAP transporter small permease n=1 Tax=Anaerosolibacter sp. TaxID=1872527 RepID=UPI0039EE9C51